jgi:hypothetical protein
MIRMLDLQLNCIACKFIQFENRKMEWAGMTVVPVVME